MWKPCGCSLPPPHHRVDSGQWAPGRLSLSLNRSTDFPHPWSWSWSSTLGILRRSKKDAHHRDIPSRLLLTTVALFRSGPLNLLGDVVSCMSGRPARLGILLTAFSYYYNRRVSTTYQSGRLNIEHQHHHHHSHCPENAHRRETVVLARLSSWKRGVVVVEEANMKALRCL